MAQPGAPMRQYKIVLLGDSGVGKTNLLTQFVKGQFLESQESTIGVAFFSHQLQMPDNSTVKLELWDTAGQERYAGLAPLYYRGAQAAVVVYDITNPKTFERAKQWIKELQQQNDLTITVALVGNKLDLQDSRKVSEKDAQTYATEQDMLFMETSAKTGRNIKDLFLKIATHLNSKPAAQRRDTSAISVEKEAAGPAQKGSCSC